MVVIVVFVAHGLLFCNVINVLYSLKDVSVHLEFGSYANGPDYIYPGRYCVQEREQIIIARVSTKEIQQE